LKEKLDEYHTANNKTALFANVSSSHQHGRHQQPAREPATLTPADASSIKGTELKKVMHHFNLPIKGSANASSCTLRNGLLATVRLQTVPWCHLHLVHHHYQKHPHCHHQHHCHHPHCPPLYHLHLLLFLNHHPPPTSNHIATLTHTPADASSVKGTDLMAAMWHFGLTIKITGKTADGQLKQLKLYHESNVSPQAEATLLLVSPAPPLLSPPPSLSSTSSSPTRGFPDDKIVCQHILLRHKTLRLQNLVKGMHSLFIVLE